ncbi:MAG: tryptophan--tRNA ligase [Nanoarchaeota archaeon]
MAQVTPWSVSGTVDYDSLIKEFGVEKIDAKLLKRLEKHTGSLHYMLRREIFFAHRDLALVLNEFEKGHPFFLYTGRAPSGHTHLGHIMPWLFTKWLQDAFKVDLWFQFPDEEKFLFKKELTYEDVQKHLQENMLDVIALGFDAKKTHFLIDTQHAGIMYPEAIKVAKRITYSTVKAVFGFDNEQNIGAIFYTAMQAVPAFLPSVIAKKKLYCLIPHGIDQDPHFRVSRDVIPKLGYPKPASIQCKFLPPLSGPDGKMSSSDPNSTIFTTDTAKEVEKKINKYAFSGGQATVEEHRRHGGNPAVDVCYQWLTFFEPDDAKLKRIYDEYKSGRMLTGELKKITIETINNFLREHQRKREEAKKKINEFIYRQP